MLINIQILNTVHIVIEQDTVCAVCFHNVIAMRKMGLGEGVFSWGC